MDEQELLESLGLQDFATRPLLEEDDDDHPMIPAEDDNVDDDMQIQEAILYSIKLSRSSSNSHQGFPEDHADDSASHKSPDLKQKGICKSRDVEPRDFYWSRSQKQRGEASWSVCTICSDDQSTGKMVRFSQCGHFSCEDCIVAYVGKMIQANIRELKCPETKCNQALSWNQCYTYLRGEVAVRWFEAALEAEILGNPTYIQCPFEDCGDSFLDDGRGFLIRACLRCWRIFCMNCRDKWHLGLSCRQFQLFRRNLWQRVIKIGRVYILRGPA